ncbi:MAG TPA: non-canonical purine NTP pyrophosphatase [Mycobacterium sp.]
MRRVLDEARLDFELVSLSDVPTFDEAPETGATFEENALAKARDAFTASGLPSVADDSGLEVDALNGMPGVLSARWAGFHGNSAEKDRANNSLLLAQLRDVPDARRGAAFVSASALVSSAGEVVVRGRWPGRIAYELLGDNGFGYDPLFIPDGLDRSAAQLTPSEKDSVSHRGRALAQLLPALRALD